MVGNSDGVKVPLVKTNIMYTGLEIAPGEHEVVLQYEMPGIKTGLLVTALSTGVFQYCDRARHLKRKTEKIETGNCEVHSSYGENENGEEYAQIDIYNGRKNAGHCAGGRFCLSADRPAVAGTEYQTYDGFRDPAGRKPSAFYAGASAG